MKYTNADVSVEELKLIWILTTVKSIRLFASSQVLMKCDFTRNLKLRFYDVFTDNSQAFILYIYKFTF